MELFSDIVQEPGEIFVEKQEIDVIKGQYDDIPRLNIPSNSTMFYKKKNKDPDFQLSSLTVEWFLASQGLSALS